MNPLDITISTTFRTLLHYEREFSIKSGDEQLRKRTQDRVSESERLHSKRWILQVHLWLGW